MSTITPTHVADFRSDTITKPTPDMRESMKNAVVGDDVWGDDTTTNLLQKKAATILGKEAALFVPSGTMANLLSVLVHCSGRGDEFIVGNKAHIYTSEQGGSAWIGGVHPFSINNQSDGTLKLEDIENAIRADDCHYPRTKLVCLENTHNRVGGRVLTVEYMDKVSALCKKHALKLHVDGARLFNASVALGIPPSRLVKDADSVSICLSKGLGAPIGSIVAGTKEFINSARRLRKAIGGGMRQVGVLAAPAIIALEVMPEKLKEDHRRANLLRTALAGISNIKLEPSDTNMVLFTPTNMSCSEFTDKLKEKGVLLLNWGSVLRLTVHHQLTDTDVDMAILAIKEVSASK
eukprot:TRINITY_DN1635_c0_g6_i1.p1 TRINITY_DN1635_c0_g6~~TRINITY_DN1635_c0_g6_i1.p1  ORF type:complete len:349 (+),score=78.52 TRINITY_DN1635_c0_g6_i1:58-1104(+)